MLEKVTDLRVTDGLVLKQLAHLGIDSDYVESDLAYAAGIIDGEGTISVRRQILSRCKSPCYWIFVFVAMCEPTVSQWLQQTFGGGYSVEKSRNPRWKDVHKWKVTTRKAEEFLIATSPFLKEKRARAEVALELRKLAKPAGYYRRFRSKPKEVLEAELILVNKLHQLNRRGRND